VVGVTGSIAAYKAADLVSALVQRGADVRVVMTKAARELVGVATFRALSGHDVGTELFGNAEFDIAHVSLAQFAEVMVVAPATANVIGKMVGGIADDLLTTNLLAVECPVVLAPAMNKRMWANATVQANVATLRERGVIVVGPGEGFLACGETGAGRLAEKEALLAAIRLALRRGEVAGRPSPLAGKRVVITAGPTREHLDPVRFISNPSSGAMGYELATEAAARGAAVTLVHGPSELPAPACVKEVAVVTAAEMAEAVFGKIAEADVFIGAAAVADYSPAEAQAEKVHKKDERVEVTLEPTVDIIAEVRRRRPDMIVVGFAAETQDIEAGAREKMARKGLDMIVANKVSPGEGFGPGETTVSILELGKDAEEVGPVYKDEAASAIIDAVEGRLSPT
jgi:phosphopantothenoylcysteine decarboxylase/phosphopantothenate--cysteine ligase